MDVQYSCQNMPANFSTIKGNNIIKPSPDGKIYWFLANETPDMNRQMVIENIVKAFDVWEDVMSPIVFEQTEDKTLAEIVITFSHNDLLNTTDPFKAPFPFNDGVLGYAFPPADHSYSSDLFINDEFQWDNIHNDDVKHLLTVLIHELGHTLNIGHSKVKGAIMYPTYDGIITRLHEDDKLAINYLYGATIKTLVDHNVLYNDANTVKSLKEATLNQYSTLSPNEMMLELQSRDEIIDKLREFGNDLLRSGIVLETIVPIVLRGVAFSILNIRKLIRGIKELKVIFSERQGKF